MTRVFICYATGDDDNVTKLCDAISRLDGIEVFVPKYTTFDGKNTAYEIKEALDNSNASVVFLTFNSTNTMWLNQEIGYSVAKNIPIILIVERGLEIVGFLQKNDYIVYQRGNFEQNICEVIQKLRLLFQHSTPRLVNFHVECTKCKKKFLAPIPPQELVYKKLEINEKITLSCKFCTFPLNVDPMTLSTLE